MMEGIVAPYSRRISRILRSRIALIEAQRVALDETRNVAVTEALQESWPSLTWIEELPPHYSYDNNLQYLSYVPLRHIFNYLNDKDLENFTMACRWSFLSLAANNEKSIRGYFCCIEWLNTTPKRIFFYNFEETISSIIPSVIFIFCHEIGYDIQHLLPDHCEAVILLDNAQAILRDYEAENVNPFSVSLSNIACVYAFLPHIPNVKIKLFILAEDCVIQESAEYQEIIDTIVEIDTIVNHDTSIPNHETSTCLMLFSNYTIRSKETAERWASALQESKEVNITSVWGGWIKYFIGQTKTMENRFGSFVNPNCLAVLITGVIQTWSTILDVNCNTKEQVEARLKLFKDEVKLKKHSIGFMFACSHMYREFDVESTIFKRLFPNVPLASCFGNSAFGKNTIDEVNEEKNDKEGHKWKKSKSKKSKSKKSKSKKSNSKKSNSKKSKSKSKKSKSKKSKSKKFKSKKSKSWYNEGSTVFLILTYG